MKKSVIVSMLGLFSLSAMGNNAPMCPTHSVNLHPEDDAEINTTRNIEYPQPSSKRVKFKKRGRK